METIQVVLDKELLRTTDRLARKSKMNRSALVREALREYAKRIEVAAREESHRAGYARFPESLDDQELDGWTKAAAWPDD